MCISGRIGNGVDIDKEEELNKDHPRFWSYLGQVLHSKNSIPYSEFDHFKYFT